MPSHALPATAMTEDLMTVVLDRASADAALPEAAKLLVLASLEGDDDLAQALDAASGAHPPAHPRRLPADADPVPPVRAYLTSVTVEGFRGVGPAATLSLHPGPGLVVVAGRNGCGKSSFAEAIEVALTRGSYRWRNRPHYWHESWRNLHQHDPASITVELAEEGRGITKIGATWAPGAGLDDATSWVQRHGERRQPGLDSLGWSAALDVYRPFLSYDELAVVFAVRTKLYGALAPILGLERLEDAQRRLRQADKTLSTAKESAAAAAKDLRPVLQDLDDPRAAAVLTQLGKRQPDLDALRNLVTTGVAPDGDLARLRELSALRAADPAALQQAIERFLAAREALRDLEQGARAADVRRTDLLATALAVHQDSGDGPCPVCGTGVLDGEWARRVEAELRQERDLARARASARTEMESASRALTAVPGQPPAALTEPPPGLGEACAVALAAWNSWAALSADADLLARDGKAALAELRNALGRAVEDAQAELQRREDRWQPVAVRVAEWLGHAERAVETRDRLAAVKAAATWLKNNAHELRNDRIRPLTERARHVWSLLRQESNVELGEITLAGSSNSRRVELTAAVDGSEAQALGVMSQGELHALALALFLPKATAPASPFGFVVIDDPVQAMDPAKVDGLARVLEEAATDRQIIVLTHDDRLPEAVRRLGVRARLVEVVRDDGSRVNVTDSSDPTSRYLDDARAVASDRKLPDGVLRRVVAELCRFAVESRSREVFFARRLATGAARVDVEEVWAKALGTRKKVALAVHDNPEASLDRWVAGGSRRAALTICASKPHEGLVGDPHRAVDSVVGFVDDLGGRRGR